MMHGPIKIRFTKQDHLPPTHQVAALSMFTVLASRQPLSTKEVLFIAQCQQRDEKTPS